MVSAATKTKGNGVGHPPEDTKPDSSKAAEGKNTSGFVGEDFTVDQYLDQRKVIHKDKGVHRLIVCPTCKGMKGKKKTKTLLVHNELGTWSCSNCNRKGGFRDLRRLLGETAPISSLGSMSFEVFVPPYTPVIRYVDWVANTRSDEAEPAMALLNKLGITDRMVRDKLFIGYDTKLNALVFSYQYERSLDSTSYLRFMRDPDDWWKVTGDPKNASWFAQHLFKPAVDEAYICQTPLDASVLIAMGEPNVLAPHVNTSDVKYRSHHLALLQRCSVIYIVPNPTDEGMRWAMATQAQIGKWRCKVIQLDDYPRHLLLRKMDWGSAKLKADSSLGISSRRASSWISEVDYEWDHPDHTKGYPVGLDPVDQLLSGWRPGEVTVLSGSSGVGKSTFASFLTLLQASEKNPSLYMTFEVLPKNILRKWLSMLSGAQFSDLSRERYVQARKKLARRPIWVADHFGMVQLEDVRKTIYESCSTNGIRYVVIDHLGHLASLGSDNEIRETGHIIRECKRWSLDLAVHIVVVAHLRKPSSTTKITARPQMEDLRGSSELYQVADNVLLLDRKRGETKCRCRVVKCRDDSGYEGVAMLDFDPDSLRYLPGEV